MTRRNRLRLVCTRLWKYASKNLDQRQSQVCHTERQDTIHLPSTQQILSQINLQVRSCNRMNLYIPHTTRGHRHSMPTGRIRLRTVSKETTKRSRNQRNAHRRTRKDPPDQENCSTHRLHGLGGNRKQIPTIPPTLDSRRTVKRKCSKHVQSVWTIHRRHPMPG